MSENPGIAPPDPTSKVGQFRFLSGDLDYVELDPPVAGQGSYLYWSDTQIESFLATSGGSISLAISKGYALFAAIATEAQSRSEIRTDDLTIASSKKPSNWLALANFWRAQHDLDSADEASLGFRIVEVGATRRNSIHRAEASAWPVPRGW